VAVIREAEGDESMSKTVSKKKEKCPKCVKRSKELPPEKLSAINPPTVYTRAEVLAKVVHKCDEQWHDARVSGVILRYELPKDQILDCRQPDKTPHLLGMVVTTLCGRTIPMGHCCCEKHVLGGKEIIAAMKRGRQQQDDLSTLRGIEDVLINLRNTLRRIEGVEEFRKRAKEYFPVLARKMFKRAETVGGGRIDVQLRNPKTDAIETLHLSGIDAWKNAPLLHGAIGDLKAIQDSMPKSDDLAAVQRAARIIRRAETRCQTGRMWINGAMSFFSEANLRLVLHDTGLEGSGKVRVVGGTLVFDDPFEKGRKGTLSANGLSWDVTRWLPSGPSQAP